MSEAKVTVVTEISKRSQLVALFDWQTTSGEPVRVRCCEVDAETCARILNLLPGERPNLGIPEEADQATMEAQTRRILSVSVDMIEHGTGLSAPDGSEVRPAFTFGPDSTSHPLSLDGNKLSDADLMQLAVAVLRCSGYLGGAAAATFLRGQRAGAHAGLGALEVLPVDRPDAAAGPEGS
jgi:hypothetical protein